jgi:hypothetical protein
VTTSDFLWGGLVVPNKSDGDSSLKIKDVIAKVASGEELTDDEKAFLETYEEPNLDAAVNAKSKKERLKLQKQIDDLKSSLEEKDAEIEEAGSDSSDMEKLQKQIEKLTLKAEASETLLANERAAHATTTRSNALKSVGVPWLESVPQAYRDTVMKDAFNDIETDDLADKDVIAPILKGIIENQASFVAASTVSGAGTDKNESKTNTSTNGKITADNVLSLDQETLVNNLDDAWKAASQGE